MYVPPISVTDTANAVHKITSHGTKIVAIAAFCFYGIGIVYQNKDLIID